MTFRTGESSVNGVLNELDRSGQILHRDQPRHVLSIANRAEHAAGPGVTVKYFGLEGIETRTSLDTEDIARNMRTRQDVLREGEEGNTGGEMGRWVKHTWRPIDPTIPAYIENNYELSHKPKKANMVRFQ